MAKQAELTTPVIIGEITITNELYVALKNLSCYPAMTERLTANALDLAATDLDRIGIDREIFFDLKLLRELLIALFQSKEGGEDES